MGFIPERLMMMMMMIYIDDDDLYRDFCLLEGVAFYYYITVIYSLDRVY